MGTSQVTYAYDGFYNQVTETQDLDPTSGGGAGNPQTITRAFDGTSTTGTIFDNAYRPTGVTYPNGREIELYYGAASSIDDNIGRVAGLDDATPNSVLGDYEITRYSYMGSGAMVRKDYTVPGVRLDFTDESGEGSNGTDPYDESFDRFGRALRYQWETYDPGTGDADESRIEIAHDYDRASNRLYDDRSVYDSQSKVYSHDELDRIDGYETGKIKSDQSGIEPNWLVGGEAFEMDQLGNVLALDPAKETQGDTVVQEFNDANEITARKTRGSQRQHLLIDDDFSDSATASNWELPAGSGDTFSINGTESGYIRFTVNQDTYDSTQEPEACVILLWKDSGDIGPVRFNAENITTDSSSQVGFVFGYQSPNDYYVAVVDKPAGSNTSSVYRIKDGVKTYIDEVDGSFAGGNDRFSPLDLRAVFEDEGGIPSGRVGLWANSSGGKLSRIRAYDAAYATTWLDRLTLPWATDTDTWAESYLSSSSDNLRLRVDSTRKGRHNRFEPALFEGVTARRFEVTFSVLMEEKAMIPLFYFNAKDEADFVRAGLLYNGSIYFHHMENTNQSSPTATKYSSAVPSISDGDTLWFRYTLDGTTFKGYVQESATKPTTWPGSSLFIESTHGTAVDVGGRVGIGTSNSDYGRFDDFELNLDIDEDGSYETLALLETFTNTDNFRDAEPAYDDAGNLVFDGTRFFTYDAQNRLIKVQASFREATVNSGDYIEDGPTLAEYRYDALNRRVEEKTYVGGVLDNVQQHYYLGWSVIETRNGSDQVVTQHVWDNLAGHYIDSLAEVTHNLNPGYDEDGVTSGTQDFCEARLFAMQDQQFNVLGLASPTGQIVERYEYTLYGKRQVFQSTGLDMADLLQCDLNGDGTVDAADVAILDANLPLGSGATRWDGDTNNDGDVDSYDEARVDAAVAMVMDNRDAKAMTPSSGSTVVPYSGVKLTTIGFQGLRLDETTGLIDNRTRIYIPDRAVFGQRDWLGYPDGANTYTPYHVLRAGVDPFGNEVTIGLNNSWIQPSEQEHPRREGARIQIMFYPIAWWKNEENRLTRAWRACTFGSPSMSKHEWGYIAIIQVKEGGRVIQTYIHANGPGGDWCIADEDYWELIEVAGPTGFEERPWGKDIFESSGAARKISFAEVGQALGLTITQDVLDGPQTREHRRRESRQRQDLDGALASMDDNAPAVFKNEAGQVDIQPAVLRINEEVFGGLGALGEFAANDVARMAAVLTSIRIGIRWRGYSITDERFASGCEGIAKQIQRTKGGGEIHRILPREGRYVGTYRGHETLWHHHEVLVKDGRVYDAFTGHTGVPVSEYKALFSDPASLDFGF